MPTTHSQRTRLKAVLDYVRRYTIGIEPLLSESLGDNVHAAVGQLLAIRKLREHRHPLGFRYVTIGNQTKLSESAFIRRYAIIRFCQSPDSHRSLLTRLETEQYFPNIFRHGMPSDHYIDTSESEPRFGHVRVDAVPARTSRIVSRAADLIERYCRNVGIRQLIARRQFEITFIVATTTKARRLQMEFHGLNQSGVTVRAHAIPELIELIAPLANHHAHDDSFPYQKGLKTTLGPRAEKTTGRR